MKKIKMKNVVWLAMLAIVPILTLTGCDGEVFFQKTVSSKSSSTFLNSVSNDFATFTNNIKAKIAIAKADVNNYFVINDLKNDTRAESTMNNNIFDSIRNINLEGLFATSIYQMSYENLSQAYFDMSFLTDKNLNTDESNQLKNFFVQTKSKDNGQIIYKYQLTGNESLNMNLPVQVANESTNIDAIDNVIKEWGNEILFDVTKQSSSSTEIKIKTNFELPDQNTVETSLAQGGFEDCRSVVTKDKVTLYYKIGGIDYIKEIETFLNNQTYEKKITKYAGTSLDSATKLGSYFYSFAESNLNLLGKYKVRYDAVNSFIYCYADHQNGYVTALEYCKTKSGELLGRFFIRESKTIERTVVDVLLNGNLETGVIKYDYQKGTTKYKTLAEEKYLTDSFVKISEDDKALAKTKMIYEVEILSYTISNNGISIERASVVEEKK